MTYKEAYLRCETEEQLLEQVKKDTATALLINSDRVKFITEAFNEVYALKFDKNNK